MSKILTSHTVPHNFKTHRCAVKRDESGHDDGGKQW